MKYIKIINKKISSNTEIKEISAVLGKLYQCELETEVSKWKPDLEEEKKFKIIKVVLDDGLVHNAISLVEQGFAKFEEIEEPKDFEPTILDYNNYPRPNDHTTK